MAALEMKGAWVSEWLWERKTPTNEIGFLSRSARNKLVLCLKIFVSIYYHSLDYPSLKKPTSKSKFLYLIVKVFHKLSLPLLATFPTAPSSALFLLVVLVSGNPEHTQSCLPAVCLLFLLPSASCPVRIRSLIIPGRASTNSIRHLALPSLNE